MRSSGSDSLKQLYMMFIEKAELMIYDGLERYREEAHGHPPRVAL